MTFIGKFAYEVDGNGDVHGAGLSDGKNYLPVVSDTRAGAHTAPSYAAALVHEVGGDSTLDMSARYAVFAVVALPDDIAGSDAVDLLTEDVTLYRVHPAHLESEDYSEEPVRVYDLPRYDPEVPHPAECTAAYEAYSSAPRQDIDSYPEPRRR